MSEPYLAEIRIMSFNFAPKGWALCNGQFMPINQNQALFSLLGTTYGGDGRTTFALPDLRGRVAVYQGAGITLGQQGGQEAHTLTIQEIPSHNHFAYVNKQNATVSAAAGNALAGIPTFAYRNSLTSLLALKGPTVTSVGGSQAHENRMPSLVLNFCIALQGIFPSQN